MRIFCRYLRSRKYIYVYGAYTRTFSRCPIPNDIQMNLRPRWVSPFPSRPRGRSSIIPPSETCAIHTYICASCASLYSPDASSCRRKTIDRGRFAGFFRERTKRKKAQGSLGRREFVRVRGVAGGGLQLAGIAVCRTRIVVFQRAKAIVLFTASKIRF